MRRLALDRQSRTGSTASVGCVRLSTIKFLAGLPSDLEFSGAPLLERPAATTGWATDGSRLAGETTRREDSQKNSGIASAMATDVPICIARSHNAGVTCQICA